MMTTHAPTLRHLLKNKEAADRLGILPGTLDQWRWQGKGPRFVKVGARVMYREQDLEDWIAANTHGTSSSAALA